MALRNKIRGKCQSESGIVYVGQFSHGSRSWKRDRVFLRSGVALFGTAVISLGGTVSSSEHFELRTFPFFASVGTLSGLHD